MRQRSMQNAISAQKNTWIAPILAALLMFAMAVEAEHEHEHAVSVIENCVLCTQQSSTDDLGQVVPLAPVWLAQVPNTPAFWVDDPARLCRFANARAPPATEIA